MPKYINIDPRYGDRDEMTIEEYQHMNPFGKFEAEKNEKYQIIELWYSNPFLDNAKYDRLANIWYCVVAEEVEDA